MSAVVGWYAVRTRSSWQPGTHKQAPARVPADGGTDYMPRMLEEYAQDKQTLLLVAVSPEDRVDAIGRQYTHWHTHTRIDTHTRTDTHKYKVMYRNAMCLSCMQLARH